MESVAPPTSPAPPTPALTPVSPRPGASSSPGSKLKATQAADDLWEVYTVGPRDNPDAARWQTELNVPLKTESQTENQTASHASNRSRPVTPINVLTSTAAPLPLPNIDTDRDHPQAVP